MNILSLELRDFRNYADQHIRFSDGLNVLYGKNASGKTNMLESIYLCSVFRSPRTSKDKELIRLGCERAEVRLALFKNNAKHVIHLRIDAAGKKKVVVDGLPISRAGELLGLLGIVFFSPDEMKLVKESPAERRRFLDVGLCQQQKNYFAALNRYNRILKQKNNLLKDLKDVSGYSDMLDVWDSQLAEYGEVIIRKRKVFIETLNLLAARYHSALSSDRESLSLLYEASADASDAPALLDMLRRSREKDARLGFCTVGPHRDDIGIEIDGRDSRKFASQGQQRTVALAMKLAEAEIYDRESGEKPVLLLDDVLSELDETRQKVLLDCARPYQTVLTCTEFGLHAEAKKFEIAQGRAAEKNG